jgi:hypothetical protein
LDANAFKEGLKKLEDPNYNKLKDIIENSLYKLKVNNNL